jgi:effector-binding domain-containing protein
VIQTPRVIQTTAQNTAVIRLLAPRSEIQKIMGPAFGEVMAVASAQGVAPSGALFTHHFRILPDSFDFEAGVRVSRPVSPSGRVRPGNFPAVKVAQTVYRGPYEGLAGAWREFDAWIVANGHTPAGDLWEFYITDPGENPDPSTWQTELNRPLL